MNNNKLKGIGMKHTSNAVALSSLLLVACAPPNVDGLEADLAELDQTLEEIDAELAQYPGGLIHGLLMTRKQLTGATRDMLEQKRSSLLYWVDLEYRVDGRVAQPATAEELASITSDLEEAQAQAAVAENEARFSGGLVGALKQAEVATAKLTVATIRHRYYAKKYDVPVILREHEDGEDSAEEKPRLEIHPDEL